MDTRLLAVGAAVSAAALMATAGVGAAARAKEPALTGQTWALATLGPLNRESAGITALFTSDGKVSGFAGCNSYSGTYTTSQGSSITVSKKLAVTQKACRRVVMAQEKAFLAALASAQTYSIKGAMLVLKGRRGKALASFAVQAQTLAGTRWNVVEYNNGKQAVVSVMASTKLTAIFGEDDVRGSAGCNDYSSAVKVTPPRISIGPIATTRKACGSPEGVMDQEAAYLAALGSAATFEIHGRNLELRTSSGALAATMEPA